MAPPTYYSVVDGRVLVSASLGPLVSVLQQRPKPSVARLASLVSVRAPDDPSTTPYEGIHRVPAHREVRVWPDGRRQTTPIASSISPSGPITPEEAARELRARIFRAISRHIRDKTRVAVFVGGGVDSSSVLASTLALARGASRPEVDAIALDFAGPGDDRPYMRDLARALGIVPIRLRPASGGPLVRRIMVLDSAPLTWPNSSFEGAMLLAARERGAQAVLGGAGGDDLFDGDPTHLATHAREGHPYQAIRDAAALRVPWRDPGITQVWDFVLRPFLVRSLPHDLRRRLRHLRRRNSLPWAGPELREFFDRHFDRPEPPRPTTASSRYVHFVTLPYLMEVIDMRSQLHAGLGIARIDPLLDDALIEFVSSLPPMMLLHGGRLRGLFRAAMQGLLPDSIRLRTDKADFEPAMAETVRAGGGFGALEDLVAMRNLERLGLVDAKAYRVAFDALARDPEGWGEGWLQVWPALAVEAFLSGMARPEC